MRLPLTFFFPLATVTAFGLACLQEGRAQQPVPRPGAALPASPNSAVAIVNGKVITRNEAEAVARFNMAFSQLGITDAKSWADHQQEALFSGLQDLVDRELMISDFERLGGVIKPQMVEERIQALIRERFGGDRQKFLQKLQEEGFSWAKFREQQRKTIIVEVMRHRAASGVGFATPQQKEEYFRKHEAEFREEGSVWLKNIAIPQLTGDPSLTGEEQRTSQRRLAEDIRRRLLDGADFATLAKAYSQDAVASNGGDRGWVLQRDLDPRLASVAFSLPLKTVSQVFEFKGYYYILLVEDRKPGKLKPQQEIDEILEKRVEAELRRNAVEQYLARLRKQATIVYPDPAFQPRPQPPANATTPTVAP